MKMKKKLDGLQPPVKIATAVKYDARKNAAPAVTATGRGVIAEKIIELAHEYGIPIKNDPELAQVLGKLKPGSEIPVELYRAVAEILAFVYSLNEGQRPKTHSKS
ncbi:MAG TPA: EscU/YscU/HrcU family type III secretion system export apparatus switch protein [Smithellaceae bacterium]|jgi:flagellar biosynthesis protein|nr:EscU/YscU/HrcU family type III secretion system export apparatus switch protein [Smithellaceae bacterium]HQF84964.1 EscU/YscU/HrcU family type III secretion system export apparatus switch protein [Smithellaceae bacterium]HQG79506.1 EscU/YscU/HrcU family type III secretion system export apparatus switch protein [Smithellaceae bacterium]